MEKVIGTKYFGSKIDITDPCYDRDVWCRMNDVEIEPGDYECYVKLLDDEETGGWGERVAEIGIRNIVSISGAYTHVYNYLGEIGVDAGLAGFFNNKPDYTGEEWGDFCSALGDHEKHAWINEDGFFSSSGYGDGEYDVYAAMENGKIVALFIEFIEPDEEDEDEDWEDYEEEDEE